MSIQELVQKIPDFAKDIRLNLDSLFSKGGTPGLSDKQHAGVALACAYATLDTQIISALEGHFSALDTSEKQAARSAATIMAMNNIYYRFLHLSDDKEFSKMPAKLRMNIIGKPGVPKVDFELMCLAVSALSGCGMCINSHVAEVKRGGLTDESVQSAVRMASVINATRTALRITG